MLFVGKVLRVLRASLGTRLRISKIIKSSKQRAGLGQIPLGCDLTKPVPSWEKQDVERELWKQNWGVTGLHAAVLWDGEQLNIWWDCRARCQYNSTVSAAWLPCTDRSRCPTALMPAQLYTNMVPDQGLQLSYPVASVTWSAGDIPGVILPLLASLMQGLWSLRAFWGCLS